VFLQRKISKVHTRPSDVQDGDYCAIKVVAVARGADGWTMFYGPPDWTDERIALNGDKALESQAGLFAYLMQLREYWG